MEDTFHLRNHSSMESPIDSTYSVNVYRFDRILLLATLILLGVSVLMVYSTTAVSSLEAYGSQTAMLRRHLVHTALGFAFMLGMFRVDPLKLYRYSGALLVIALSLLAAVLIPGIGHRAGGAIRWIGFGFVRIQPGELAKFAAILYMASYIGRHHRRMYQFKNGIILPFIVVSVFAALLLAEPDFGSTVVILCVVFGQLLLVSRMKHLVSLGLAGVSMLGMLVLISPYRMRRFISFVDPFQDPTSSGYQLIQSLIAVGSGGLTGQGLGAGKQKLFYLPAAHTDFIYAVIAEELGLVGALAVLLLFLVIAYRGLRIARQLSENPYLSSLAVGCTLLFVLPALLNIGVVIGILPTKGLVLPLVAYGGTAMIVHLATMGVLLRLSVMETS